MSTATLERPSPDQVSHHYEPRGAASRLLMCREPEVLLSGPAGTGKSRACLEKVNLLCLMNEGARGLIVRKTLVSLTSTGLVTWREKVVPEGLKHRVLKFFGGNKEEPAQYQYSNGSTVTVGGMDDPMKIMSSEYDFIYVQEATELVEDEWEKLTTRLRNGRISFQQLMADCNPDRPTHWLKVRCDRGGCLMVDCQHEDNPVLFDAVGGITPIGRDYLKKLDALTGVRYQRLRRGLWVAADGLVYEGYDPAVHVVDALPKGSEHWARYWVIDFGYSNPFVCQWWAVDPDGGLWMYREIYKTKTLVEDHAVVMLNAVRKPNPAVDWEKAGREPDVAEPSDWVWTEPKPQKIVCDHDAEDRATLQRKLGMGTAKAHKTVKDGIEAVQSRFKVDERGKTRIHFLRDTVIERDQELEDAHLPASTVEEIVGYVWPKGVKPKDRENPVKENDHGMDTTRYMVADQDLKGRTSLRWM